jgi:tetratricopeptide (TPR) repeat protein
MPRFRWKGAKPSVITLADQARDQGQWERAAGYYRDALSRNPQRPPIWVQYGHVLKEAGHLADAERAYRTALAYDPRIADTHLQLGHVLRIQGKKVEARAAYLLAFALDPSLNGASFEFAQLGWSEAHVSELRGMLGTDITDPPKLGRWQMSVDGTSLVAPEAAADACERFALALESAGHTEAACYVFEAAAELDLSLPHLQVSWGGPMNGQQGRQQIFLDLINAVTPVAIIETGTYRGTTTEWIAEVFNGPIFTCEINKRFFVQSRRKLSRFPNITILNMDSREFLKRIVGQSLDRQQPLLFYLDAHWRDDLPLYGEARFILETCPMSVLVIDDFQVPFDDGYGFDDYGPGRRFSLEILGWLKDTPQRIFFPILPSSEETGAKRGAVVIASESMCTPVSLLSSLKGESWLEWRREEAATDTGFARK